MKKATICLLALGLLLSLCSCAVDQAGEETSPAVAGESQPATETTAAAPPVIDTGKYTIYWENEKCYMAFPPVTQSDTKEEHFVVSAQYPEFSSVQEMKKKLSEGDLSEAEIEELRRVTQQGTYEICNINDLYEAVLPENVELTMVRFLGTAYDFTFRGSEGGAMYCVSEEIYESGWEHGYKGIGIGKESVLLSTETVADRNAEVRTYAYAGLEIKRVFYTHETVHGQQRVYETYRDGKLSCLYLFGESNGAFYIVVIPGPSQRPSLEWLASFYLKKFVETETS